MGVRQARRELGDQAILFMPYYFAEQHWQAYFGNKAAIAELNKKIRRGAFKLSNFMGEFDDARSLFVPSKVGAWPAEVEAYKSTIDLAVETFLERIHTWSNSSSASLD